MISDLVTILKMIIVYSILFFLVMKFIIAQRKKNIIQVLIFGTLLLCLVFINFILYIFYEGISCDISLFTLVIAMMKVVIVYLIVNIVFIIKDKKTSKIYVYVSILAILLCYYDIVAERIFILYNLVNMPVSQDPITYFSDHYNRFPFNFEDVEKDRHFAEIFDNFFKLKGSDRITYWNPGLVKRPKFKIKTWIEDTLIYSEMYSLGFDNDDDSLKKSISIFHYKPWVFGIPFKLIYVLSPIVFDSDLSLPWSYYTTIYDRQIETVFIHQLWNLQGKTLSPKEYEDWLKRRHR